MERARLTAARFTGAWTLTRQTWEAILRRWLLPILLVGAPILWAQREILHEEPLALYKAAAMLTATLLLAPVSWQLLFPLDRRPWRHPLHLAAFIGFGALVIWLSLLTPWESHELTYVFTEPDPGLLFALGLFYVSGYGLGRGVQMEASLRAEQARVQALSLEAERARLMAVRSHLDPHFLFNTLNAIAEWCQEDPAVAERALLQLSAMLRVVLTAVQTSTWPLARELELVAALGALYATRDPERFQLEASGWEAEAALTGVTVPPMLLLSLAENAFKHGPAAGHTGPVRVTVAASGDGVVVAVENPGAFAGPREGGEGLTLVQRRLALAYEGRGRFTIEVAGDGTLASLHLPREKA